MSLNISTFSLGLLVVDLSLRWIGGKYEDAWPSFRAVLQACHIALGESHAF